MAIKGLGCVLAVNFSGSDYDIVAKRVQITGPALKVRTKETTHLDSSKAEHIATIAEAGELSLDLEYDPQEDTHASLFGLWNDQESDGTNMHLIFTDSELTQFAFKGILTGFEISGMGFDDWVKASVKILINGDITVTTTA